jgi:CBS domain-containing membrane protein
MYTIDEIMTTDLTTLNEDSSLFAAKEIMEEQHIRHLPILNSAGDFVGLVTNRDVLAATVSVLVEMTEREKNDIESSISVKDIMCKDVYVANESLNLMEAAHHLIQYKHGCLPVVIKGKLKGIITDTDFVQLSVNLLEQMEMTEPLEMMD